MRSVWEIPSLPFIFRALEMPHNPPGIPDAMPFHLGIHQASGRFAQLPTPRLDSILARAYADGSMITGVMQEEGIGRQYTEDFLSVVTGVVGRERLDGLSVLEIGSGTGYLLHRLQLLGARVRGVEPGPQGERAAERYDVRVERGFFPGVDVGDGYDLVILYLLLEHVPDPESVLRAVADVARPGGTVLVAVQDEEPYIRSGEISLLFHEHYSYFSARTLERTIRTAGATEVDVRRSAFSNLLFAIYLPDDASDNREDVAPDIDLALAFRSRAEKVVASVWNEIDAVRDGHGTIGLFVPSRAANVLAMRKDTFEGIRFFDDNSALKGTYFPGIPIPIEDREDLFRSPPSRVLIMSLSFGTTIADAVRPHLPKEVELRPLSVLL
jgi:SAM-dependent methyltransferase